MNIREVRKKIKSVVNVKKITKAMELVSAIKMKKAQQVAFETQPYRKNLEKMIQKLIKDIDMDNIEESYIVIILFLSYYRANFLSLLNTFCFLKEFFGKFLQ